MKKLDKRLKKILKDLNKQGFGIIRKSQEVKCREETITREDIYVRTEKKKGGEIISLIPLYSAVIIHRDYERVMQNPRFEQLINYFIDEDYWIGLDSKNNKDNSNNLPFEIESLTCHDLYD